MSPAHAAAPAEVDPDAPDLAVVIANGTGRTTSVRSGEQDFARLWKLLAPSYTDTEEVPEDWIDGRHPPVRATVLWGLTGVGGWPETDSPPRGDVYMGRQDQVFRAEDGTPWVRTDPSVDVNDDDIRWHRAPRSVFDQLERRELFGPAPTEDGKSDPLAGAWWAIPGLAAGLALGSGGTRLIRRVMHGAAAQREPRPPKEPRQELIDL
ncbi:hypothetical protein FGD71_012940 [Streptomyces sporangiiformans]|uniref:Uncharacterized protein n=1 Tax=Streptomyces sporangiiformans TaxID=2315329 RepID=A0A505DIS0_9ACTN|nr:hypothetical protein FGD71_012940 [Streptomyces sporangiiformans]